MHDTCVGQMTHRQGLWHLAKGSTGDSTGPGEGKQARSPQGKSSHTTPHSEMCVAHQAMSNAPDALRLPQTGVTTQDSPPAQSGNDVTRRGALPRGGVPPPSTPLFRARGALRIGTRVGAQLQEEAAGTEGTAGFLTGTPQRQGGRGAQQEEAPD